MAEEAPSVSGADDEAIEELAGELRSQHDLEEAVRPYRDLRYSGRSDGLPTLHLEDVTGIPFVSGVPGVEEYQHRARVRASDGDLFAAVTAPMEGYEEYCREHLGLGSASLIHAEPTEAGPMAVARACADGTAYETLRIRAEDAGGLAIHPYMGIEAVWELGSKLRADLDGPVEVLAPPPPVLWLANDKSSLSHLVSELVGEEWLVETHRASAIDEMVEHLRALAGRHEQVALKRTRCASAMGNLLIDARWLRERGREQLRLHVEEFLRQTEWEGAEEVLLVEWAASEHSPSTQIWIPPRDRGVPRLDGIYEQLLEGEERVFLGSRPSTLPASLEAQLADASLAVASVMQRLGYVGRCSFDFIVPGDPYGGDGASVQPRFVECNGRWGGTSTPMMLVDRLVGKPRPHYVAQDFVHSGLIGASFDDVAGRLRDAGALFDPRALSPVDDVSSYDFSRGRYILYNVGPLRETGKLDVISLGPDPESALRGIRELEGVLGL